MGRGKFSVFADAFGLYGWRITMKSPVSILISLFAAVAVVFAPAAASELIGVRFGPDGDKTRIVFDISGAPVYAITGDDLAAGRLVVDFQEFSVPAGALALTPGKGHIERYQFLRTAEGGARAVFAFKKTAKIKEQFVIEPSSGVKKHRLVIDLVSADKAAFLASLPSRYPDLTSVIEQATANQPDFVAPSPTQREVNNARPTEKRVIVVDAGHGGFDPGAQGQSGTLEKHVTMKAALRLKEILEKTGRYSVILTRNSDDDKRIIANQRKELARRETLAREQGADLFISLHADALAQHAVRGGSVYTLSDKGAARSTKLATADGNYTYYELDAAKYDEVAAKIILDKAQDKTNSASAQFASTLLASLTGVTPLLNKSHRTGDLRVLLAPDVPAVLLEMAYISNAKDESNLNSAVWRSRTMGAVAKAIDSYFEDADARRVAGLGAAGIN